MNHRVEFFPSDLLSSLSKQCENVNKEVAFVLGNHSHLERLVLLSKNLATDSNGDSCLTDDAFLPLIPQMEFNREGKEMGPPSVL